MKITTVSYISTCFDGSCGSIVQGYFPTGHYGCRNMRWPYFGGAVFIKDKKRAFVLPILSMFLPMFFTALYMNGLSTIQGFTRASCSITAYFAGPTLLASPSKKINVVSGVAGTLASPSVYFILSNLVVWAVPADWQAENMGWSAPHL